MYIKHSCVNKIKIIFPINVIIQRFITTFHTYALIADCLHVRKFILGRSAYAERILTFSLALAEFIGRQVNVSFLLKLEFFVLFIKKRVKKFAYIHDITYRLQ